jgi:hypothetical protein
MSKSEAIQNAFGTILGIVGGAISKYSMGFNFLSLMDYFPDPEVLIPGCISAGIYAIMGYVATQVCRFVYRKIKLIISKTWQKE